MFDFYKQKEMIRDICETTGASGQADINSES